MKENNDEPVNDAGTAPDDVEDLDSTSPELTDEPFTMETEQGAGAEFAAEEDVSNTEKSSKPKKSRKGWKKPAEKEAVELRLLRLQADFDNFRKRTLREKKDLYTRANEDIVQGLLPVLDHMDLALSSAREHNAPQALLDGFALVYEQFITALKKFNVSIIDAAGAEFDPNLHEAVSHIGSPDVREGGIITQIRKGYMLGGQLLQPAQVVVSSGSPEESNSNGQALGSESEG